MAEQSFEGQVWQKMSAINVNEHTKKVGGKFTYLAWTWAWAKLMENYPQSNYSFKTEHYPDGTAEVWCDLTIGNGEYSFTRSMWLPVMDNRNNAITNANARHINDTRMRCLVKAISIASGLGSYIYAGESIPQAEVEANNAVITEEQFQRLMEGIQYTQTDEAKFCRAFRIEQVEHMKAMQFDEAISLLNKKAEKILMAEGHE